MKIIKTGNIIIEKKCYYQDYGWRNYSKELTLNHWTGEFKKKKVNKYRGVNLSNVRRTIMNMRNLINCNYKNGDYFTTLTYKINQRDGKQAWKDLAKFIRSVSAKDYLACIEPQHRGSYHFHILTHQQIDISNWKHGITHQKQITSISNVGAYISSYLISDEKKVSRLYLYEKGIRMYNNSRNLIKPQILDKLPGNINMTYEKKHTNMILEYRQYEIKDI